MVTKVTLIFQRIVHRLSDSKLVSNPSGRWFVETPGGAPRVASECAFLMQRDATERGAFEIRQLATWEQIRSRGWCEKPLSLRKGDV